MTHSLARRVDRLEAALCPGEDDSPQGAWQAELDFCAGRSPGSGYPISSWAVHVVVSVIKIHKSRQQAVVLAAEGLPPWPDWIRKYKDNAGNRILIEVLDGRLPSAFPPEEQATAQAVLEVITDEEVVALMREHRGLSLPEDWLRFGPWTLLDAEPPPTTTRRVMEQKQRARDRKACQLEEERAALAEAEQRGERVGKRRLNVLTLQKSLENLGQTIELLRRQIEPAGPDVRPGQAVPSA